MADDEEVLVVLVSELEVTVMIPVAFWMALIYSVDPPVKAET
jgi:hypothetical protein